METKTNRLALVVEDDPSLQAAMAGELARLGFEVRSALHYEAAVDELAGAGRPSLVCIDLALPTLSGYELCEYLRGPLGLARVPILVTSESGFPEDMACAEEAGASAFLKKPFSMREFTIYVEALLARVRPSEPGMARAVV
jgi:DNA-binding response OmpR family regulator